MAASRSIKTAASALERLIDELEQDRSLSPPNHLRQRIEAVDRLDRCLSFDQSTTAGSEPIEKELLQRARRICAKLESANQKLYRSIRRDIQEGAGPESLLRQVPRGNTSVASTAAGQNYDYLDDLISGVLQFEEPSTDVAPLAPEMVPYQPTPARHIFDLISRTELTERDLFIDLGSGLGHVPLVVSICTQARCIGIELEAAYVRCARKAAESLKLKHVKFIQSDACALDLSGGTIFYLYTPFVGSMLRAVLDSLRQEALNREIRICTFGPCTRMVGAEHWLKVTGPADVGRVTIFRSCC